ncbi:MAG TPA: heme biosynthesis HemY N-terminal domain-containing protein [Xanthobacteraceae bacterium]|nr:heme biosynthesis HemY N-terminal domain-containing protein [Xanthobacteraceae bacterium]
MIRVLYFLIIVGALSLGVAWLADRPGDVVITWQGWRIETSLTVLGAAILALMVLLALLWSLLRGILRSPFMLRALLHNRRGARAYEAISRGLIAVGAGDVGAARKFTAEVKRIAPAEPLALLLSAQAAQLAGDREAADRAFRAMAGRADTKALGLHGLFIEAQRRADLAGARAYAEEAARTSPSLGWAGKAVLEFRCATGDWAGALALLEQNRRVLNKASYRRQRAVMLTARALAVEETDRDNAKIFALEAVKLAPTLVPAAALAGRLHAEAGDTRKAARIIEKAWRTNPHPDLAQVFSELRFGDAARDRLKRIEGLAKKAPGHLEGALALARAALDAREFAKARAVLAAYLAVPTKRVALLMAELERAERADEGRAREWIARALNAAPDPAWTADGYVSDRWLPVSPVSGRLDTFEWRVPLSGIAGTAPMIEPEPRPVAPVASTEEAQPAAAPAAPPPRRRSARTPPTPPKLEPVIPLVHAPDDPGPEAVEENEEPRVEPQNGWRKIFE